MHDEAASALLKHGPVTDVAGIAANYIKLPKDGAGLTVESLSDLENVYRVKKPALSGIKVKIVDAGKEVHPRPGQGIILSMCDWHYTADDLCEIFAQSYGMILTHRFQSGAHVGYGGEYKYIADTEGVSMSVRGGSTYVHGYHRWEDEGHIVGNFSVLRYKVLAQKDEFAVIYVMPLQGEAPPSFPRLKSVKIGLVKRPALIVNEDSVTYEGKPLDQAVVESLANRVWGNATFLGQANVAVRAQTDGSIPSVVYADAARLYHLKYVLPRTYLIGQSLGWKGVIAGFSAHWGFSVWLKTVWSKARDVLSFHTVYTGTLPPLDVGARMYMDASDRKQPFPTTRDDATSAPSTGAAGLTSDQGSSRGNECGGESKATGDSTTAPALPGSDGEAPVSSGQVPQTVAQVTPSVAASGGVSANVVAGGVQPLGVQVPTSNAKAVPKVAGPAPGPPKSNGVAKSLHKSRGDEQTAKHHPYARRSSSVPRTSEHGGGKSVKRSPVVSQGTDSTGKGQPSQSARPQQVGGRK